MDGGQAGLGAVPRRHTLPSAAHLLLCLPACLQVLNIVAESVLEGHPKAEQKLKEVLGHTPRQVGRRRRPGPSASLTPAFHDGSAQSLLLAGQAQSR